MQSPQVEHGYTKIANDILRILAAHRIPGVEMQCLMVIFLHTYTWHKKSAEIKNKTFCEMTGVNKKHVSRALKSLSAKNVIIITKNDDKSAPTYQFNKYYKKWKLSPKKGTKINQTPDIIIEPENTAPEIIDFVPKNDDKPEDFVPKNDDVLSPNMVTKKTLSYYRKNIKEHTLSIYNTSVVIYKKYTLEIQPLKKSFNRCVKNIQKHLKKFTAEDLITAQENYATTINFNESPQYRKDPANFYGINEKPFLDYLPDVFEPNEKSVVYSKTTSHNINVANQFLVRRGANGD